MGFLDVIMTAITGGGFGAIGAIASKIMGVWEAKEERKNKALDFQHELALLDKQSALRQAETESELAIATAETAASLREASYAHDTRSGKPYQWVVSILRLIRPVLTIGLLGILGSVYFYVADLSLQAEIVHAFIFMSVSSVTWWFGDRSMNREK